MKLLALVDFKYTRVFPFRRAARPRLEAVLGLQALRFTAPLRRSGGRADRALEPVLRLGADIMCFSDDFPEEDKPRMREAELGALHPKLLLRLCKDVPPQGDTVLLTGGADALSIELLELLTEGYRYVLTRGMPRSTTEKLRRATGASVIEEPSDSRAQEASFAVFSARGSALRLGAGCVALSVRESLLDNVEYTRFVPRPELLVRGETPAGFSRQVIIAEALRRGALSPDSVDLGPCQILTKQYK